MANGSQSVSAKTNDFHEGVFPAGQRFTDLRLPVRGSTSAAVNEKKDSFQGPSPDKKLQGLQNRVGPNQRIDSHQKIIQSLARKDVPAAQKELLAFAQKGGKQLPEVGEAKLKQVLTGKSFNDTARLQAALHSQGYGKLLGSYGYRGIDGKRGFFTNTAVEMFRKEYNQNPANKEKLLTNADAEKRILQMAHNTLGIKGSTQPLQTASRESKPNAPASPSLASKIPDDAPRVSQEFKLASTNRLSFLGEGANPYTRKWSLPPLSINSNLNPNKPHLS